MSLPIGRLPGSAILRCVDLKQGDHAVTHYEPIAWENGFTLLKIHLETGRTHQIRVHLAWSRHPLLGDTVYGSRKKSPFALQGQCLHAGILGFIHPSTGEYIETHAPLPKYFEDILFRLN